jgi:serine protease AprX
VIVAAALAAVLSLPGAAPAAAAVPSWRDAIGLADVPAKWQGDDVTVASIDTGAVPSANLGDRLLARVDLTDDHDGLDRFGHGTHMAGLIAGDGTTSDGVHQGAAPDANLVSVKVAGWDGATDVSTVIGALQWVVSHRARYGIRVVNLSWGTDSLQPAAVDPLNAAVQRAWRAGLVVVVSAGNRGTAPVSKPGDDPFAITVGAADTAGTADPGDDAVAPFSSHGGNAKPDLLAPGVSVVSDRAPGSTIDIFAGPESRVGPGLFKGTGTSQAAAVVSGVAARLLSAEPELTPDEVKAALLRSADGRLAGPAGGAGMVDAAGALELVTRGAVPDAAGEPPAPSTGLGSLDASRGSEHVVADGDGDGAPAAVAGEVDVLGAPWDAAAAAGAAWTARGWERSSWAPLTSVVAPGSAPAPAWSGPPGARMAWEAAYWGARSPLDAGWDARYWGARYWGARYWGARYWGTASWR